MARKSARRLLEGAAMWGWTPGRRGLEGWMGLRRSLVREGQEAEKGEHCDPAFFDLHPQLVFTLFFGMNQKKLCTKCKNSRFVHKAGQDFIWGVLSLPGKGGGRLRDD